MKQNILKEGRWAWRIVLAAALCAVVVINILLTLFRFNSDVAQEASLSHFRDSEASWSYFSWDESGNIVPLTPVYNEYDSFSGFAEDFFLEQAEGDSRRFIGYSCLLWEEVTAPVLCLSAVTGPIIVFLNDTPIYSDVLSGRLLPSALPDTGRGVLNESEAETYRTVTLTLPEDYNGKTLTVLEMIPPWRMSYDFPVSVLLQNENTDIIHYTAEYAPFLIVSGVLISVAVFFSLLFVYQIVAKRDFWTLLCPILYTLLVLLDFSALPYFADSLLNTLSDYATFARFYAGDLLLLFLSLKLMGRYRYIPAGLAGLHFALGMAELFYKMHKGEFYIYPAAWLSWIQMAAILLVFGMMIYEKRKGNRFFTLLLPGVIVFCMVFTLLAFLSWQKGGLFFVELYPTLEHARLLNFSYMARWISFYFLFASLVFSAYSLFSDTVKKNVKLNILALKNALFLESFHSIRQAVRQSKIARHDLRHHIVLLQSFLQEGNYDYARTYLQELNAQTDALPPVQYCENILLELILRNRVENAKKAGIQMTCHVEVSEDLPVKDSDLCSLLMNMLENAAEACARLQSGERWIQLNIRQKENLLAISCKNTWDGVLHMEGKAIHSSKKRNSEVHGLGIEAMRKIAEAYQSVLDITYDSAVFSVATCLQLDERPQADARTVNAKAR